MARGGFESAFFVSQFDQRKADATLEQVLVLRLKQEQMLELLSTQPGDSGGGGGERGPFSQ